MSSLPLNESQFDKLINDLSQLPSFTIGRSGENQLILPSGKISGCHARLIQCTPNSFILEDLGSKNGSFVNGIRITRKIIDTQDKLRLADTDLTVNDLLALATVKPVSPTPVAKPAPLPAKPLSDINPLDFTSSFADLKQVYEQYPKLRRDCRNREKMIRTGSVILSSIVGISSVLSTGGAALPLLHIMSGAGLSVLVPTLCSSFLSTDEKLELIDKEYRDKYRCPNPACRDSFGSREWELLAQQKTCRRCQAIWVN